MLIAHYDSTGLVRQFSKASRPYNLQGLFVAVIVDLDTPDVANFEYRIDFDNFVQDEYSWDVCTLIATPRPLGIDEVKALRNEELRLTDQYMVEDFPVTPAQKKTWADYRKVLRDLGSLKSATEMLNAWPKRPDGLDPVILTRIKHNLPEAVQSIAP